MKRPIRALMAVAAIAGGSIFSIPTVAAGQEASTDKSGDWSPLRCERGEDHQDIATLVRHCSYRYQWGSVYWTNRGGREYLEAWDRSYDNRSVSAHAVWREKSGRRHHNYVTAGPASSIDGTSVKLGIPDGTVVHVFMCLEKIGCSEWSRTHA